MVDFQKNIDALENSVNKIRTDVANVRETVAEIAGKFSSTITYPVLFGGATGSGWHQLPSNE